MDLSVIIPHKNIFPLLERCLESIPNWENIEVIVVDDNSIDADQSVIVSGAKSNVRFFFTKENKGAGYARNVGLRNASGKWVLFADADDFFYPDTFNIFRSYFESNSDIIFFGMDCRCSNSLKKAKRNDGYYCSLIADYQNNKEKSEKKLRYKFVSPCCKMIRTNMLKEYDIQFEEIRVANDVLFSTKAGHYAKGLEVNDTVVYCATLRNESLTQTKSRRNKFCIYKTILRYNSFLRSVGQPEYQMSGVLSRGICVVLGDRTINWLRKIKNFTFTPMKHNTIK